VPCFPAGRGQKCSPHPALPSLLQALLASPLRWLRRLAWLLMFGALCELAWRLRLPPYTPKMLYTLVATWVAAWLYCLLLATQTISGASNIPFFMTIVLSSAPVMVLKEDVEAREADIEMLQALRAEAGRRAQQLPQGLDSLRHAVTTFRASIHPAVALAKEVLDGVKSIIALA
jgi:hypothetical protein